MSEIAIQVEHLGKQYRIGQGARSSYQTLREQIMQAAKAPLRGLHSSLTSENSIWALNDVSFEVQQGDVLGIIGRNGAGKSTLLKLISRITKPTRGTIDLYGRVGSLLEVGTGFHPELTGRENIYLNGAILGMRRVEIEKKFDEMVAFSEIEKFIDTPVKFYSSGMYTRLAFSVAAHLEPEILLVDEVLAVGDAEFQKKCLGKMGDVAKEGRTVLFVSHNMAAIQRLCTRAMLLNHGEIALMGDVEGVTSQYLEQASTSELSWTRTDQPKKAAYIESVMICDEEERPVDNVTTSGHFSVDIRLCVQQPVRELQVSVGLMDSIGSQIFGTAPQDAGVQPPNDPGSYRAVVHMPPEILLPKPYGIRVALWTPLGGLIDAADSIRFLPTETASLANSTPQGRSGLLALRCDWTLEKTNQK